MGSARNYYLGILFRKFQHLNAWRDLPGHRHGKLFIGRPCKKRADELLKLSRHQLKMAVAILTGHVAVRKHLRTMGLFAGDPTCRFCRKEAETVQNIACGCKALARQPLCAVATLNRAYPPHLLPPPT
jgi:hypothetical protein